MFSTGTALECGPAAPASIRSIVVRARLAGGAVYYDVFGQPLRTEQDVLVALERDHVIHYQFPEVRRMVRLKR